MSLETKLGFLNRFKTTLASSCAAYSLAVGLALGIGTALYGCGKDDEPEEGNQRYACEMGGCVPDSNGPYAVSDCNDECGEDNGNGQQMDYLTVTRDGVPQCPLGWSKDLVAYTEGSATITVLGNCSVGEGNPALCDGHYRIRFSPVPPPGDSASCSEIIAGTNMCGYKNCDPSCFVYCDNTSGSATVTGTPGSFRVAGNCSCDSYSAEFSLPLQVQ